MNQKDYKAISEIMKDTNIGKLNKGYVCKRLADYFEREDKLDKFLQLGVRFNREQFLKDCGVK